MAELDDDRGYLLQNEGSAGQEFLSRRAQPGETLADLQARREEEDAVAQHNAQVDAYRQQQEQIRQQRDAQRQQAQVEAAIRSNESISGAKLKGTESEINNELPDQAKQAQGAETAAESTLEADKDTAGKRTWFGFGGPTDEATAAQGRLQADQAAVDKAKAQEAQIAQQTEQKKRDWMAQKAQHDQDAALADQVDQAVYLRNQQRLRDAGVLPADETQGGSAPQPSAPAPVSASSTSQSGGSTSGSGQAQPNAPAAFQQQGLSLQPGMQTSAQTPDPGAEQQPQEKPKSPVDMLPLDNRTWGPDSRAIWKGLTPDQKRAFVTRQQQQAQQMLDDKQRAQAGLEAADALKFKTQAMDPSAPAAYVVGRPAGLVQAGNIDINHRPIAKNADGSISTVRSISLGTDKGTVLIPTVVNGKVVSNDDAIRHWKQTGENLGTFKDEASANAYAERLHNQQDLATRGDAEGPSIWSLIGEGLKGGLAPVMKGVSSLGTGVLDTAAAAQRAAGGNPQYGTEALASGINQYWEDAIPESVRDSVQAKLAEGLGGALTFIPGGEIGAAMKAPKIAVPIISAITGAITQGGQAYREARDQGLNDQQTFEKFALNTGLGTTAAVGVGRVFARLNKFTRGGLGKFLLEQGKTAVEQAGQQAVQTAGSDLIDNLVLPKDDPRQKSLDAIWKDAKEAGVYGAANGLLFGMVMAGAHRQAMGEAVSRNNEAIGQMSDRVERFAPEQRYADIAERVNAMDAAAGKPSTYPPASAETVKLAAELDGQTPTADVAEAKQKVDQTRLKLDEISANGGTFWNPADLESILKAQGEHFEALRQADAANVAHSAELGMEGQPVPASFSRALTMAREVERFDDAIPQRENGRTENVSQRTIAETIARIASGQPATAADLKLRGDNGDLIFHQDKDGRITIQNPVTQDALRTNAPTIYDAWNQYETRPVPVIKSPGAGEASSGAPTEGEGLTPRGVADDGSRGQQAPGGGQQPGRYRLTIRRADGSPARHVEFEAADERAARKLVDEGQVPGLVFRKNEKFDPQTDLEEVHGPVAAPKVRAQTDDEKYGPKSGNAPVKSNAHSALAEEIRKAVGPQTDEERAAISRVSQIIGPALDGWRKAFRNVRFQLHSARDAQGNMLKSSGFSFDPASDSLVVNVADVLREASNKDPQALNRRILEEFIHQAAVDARVDAAGLYGQLPEALRSEIESAYPGAVNDFQRGHEFLRMVAQNRVMIRDDGKLVWRDEGGHETTEQLTPTLGQKIRDAVGRLVKYFTDLAGNLRKQGASEQVIGSVDHALAMIRHNMAPMLEESASGTEDAEPRSKSTATPKNDNDNLQFTIPDPVRRQILNFGAKIPDSELYTGEGGSDSFGGSGYGREHDTHITVLYGPNADPANIAKAVSDIGPVKAMLGKVSIFSNPETPYDVVKVDVVSPKLRDLHEKLKAKFGTASTFPNFEPHITIAYVKKGEGEKYVGAADFTGKIIELNELDHSDRESIRTPITLSARQQATNPIVSREPASGDTQRGEIALGGETIPTAGAWSAKSPRGPEVVHGTAALVPLRLLRLNTQISDAQDRMNREQTGAAQRAEIVRNMTMQNVPLAWDVGNSLVEGSPIIDPSGSVLVGNNRAMALRDVYGDPNQRVRAEFYSQWARKRAAELGIPGAADAYPGEPVALVRVSSDLGGLDTGSFVKAANKAGTQQKTTAEHALSEADIATGLSDSSPDQVLGEFYRQAGQPEDMRNSAGRPDEAKIRQRFEDAKLAALLRPAPEGAQTATQVIDRQGERPFGGALMGSLRTLANTAARLRAKRQGGVADALGNFAQKLVQNQIAEGSFEQALRRTAEQSEANIDPGSDSATVQKIADGFRDEIAYVTTRNGNARFDPELTLEGIGALMDHVIRAVDAHSAEPDLFGNPQSVGEKIAAAIDRYRQLKDQMLGDHPEGGALHSQAGMSDDEAADLHLANVALANPEATSQSNRFTRAASSDVGRENLTREYRRLFDMERSGRALTPGQRAALEDMESALGQRLLFDVQQKAPLMRQLPLLSQAVGDAMKGNEPDSFKTAPNSENGGRDSSGTGFIGKLSSQGAHVDFNDKTTLDYLDQLTARAMAETFGNRKVGDPRLAFAADNEHWMAMDQLRKEEFQQEKDRDWEAAARRLVGSAYNETMQGILDRGFAGEQLNPIETKAAQLLIANETSLPRTDERRRTIQKLIYAYRETGTAAGRSLTSRRDPFKTKADRYREFFARRLFTPPPAIQKLIESAPSRATLESRIADLERKLELAKSQSNVHEVASIQKDLQMQRQTQSKESILDADNNGRVKKILDKLAKTGVTEDDLLGDQIELRLMGAKIIKDVAADYSDKEKATLRLLQQSLGKLPMRVVADRVGLPLRQVMAINDRFREQMKKELADRFERGVNLDELELSGMQTALFSQGGREPRSRADAEKMAEQALKMMGFYDSATRDKIKVRRQKVKVQPREPNARDVFGSNPDFRPPVTSALPLDQPGSPLERNPDYTGTLNGPEQPLPANPDFQTGRNGRLLPEPQVSYRDALVAMKLDPESDVDMLHLHRAVSQAEGGRWVDWANELLFNNMLSAPVTVGTHISGYAYAAYEMSVLRAIEAGINRIGKNSPDAAQFGEFRAMARALGKAWSRAIVNGHIAWSTESPIFEKDALGSQQEFTSSAFEQIRPRIPGTVGKIVRLPTRGILVMHEAMKTLVGQTQAAAIAYRMGKARGLTKEALERFIDAQISGQGTPAWQVAYKDAMRMSFHSPLRTFETMRKEGEVNPVNLMGESILKFMQDFKNKDAHGNVGIEIAQLMTNLIMPFVRIPYHLLQVGLEITPLGALMKEIGARDQRVKLGDGTIHIVSKGENAKVAARAMLVSSALLTLLVAAAGEGDTDDDDKPLLITGSRPRGGGEDSAGLRQLGERTVPEYSIRIGGKNGVVFSYQRFDPFSIGIATTVDALRGLKETARGRTLGSAGTNILASLYEQMMDKANLQGLSELNDVMTGRQDVARYAINTAAGAMIPNFLRSVARNADPYARDTNSQPLSPQQIAYDFVPAQAIAPPPRVDIYGRPVEKGHDMLTRMLVPGQSTRKLAYPEPLDAFLTRYNLLHPGEPWAPAVPLNRTDKATGEQMSAKDYFRFLTIRGNLFKQYAEETGVLGNRAPTSDDVDEIKKAAMKATRDAKAMMEEQGTVATRSN